MNLYFAFWFIWTFRIRGLVPGGVADQDGRLSPGDQIIRVNEIKFDMRVYSLKDCVEVLKGLPPGIVKIGVRKVDEDADEPVVLEDNEETVIEESINFEQNRNQMAALAPVIKQPIQIVSFFILWHLQYDFSWKSCSWIFGFGKFDFLSLMASHILKEKSFIFLDFD